MEDLKKRGRPSFKLSGDESSGEGGGLATGGTSTPPKKRGRPANPDKVKKSPSGRGRGRPAKYPTASLASKPNAGGDSGEDGAPTNGEATVTVSAGRGRPPKKNKLKIEATGKGRGRPKNPPKSDQDDDDDEDDDMLDNESMDDTEKPEASPQKVPGKRGRPPGSKKKAKRGPGRPPKVVHSDDDADEASDDEEKPQPERKPLGRPPSGGTKLNIVATGRGKGRPKKSVAARRALEAANGAVPKRRGRPPSGKAPAPKKSPTGRPRGRPKTKVDTKVAESESQEDEESQEDVEENDDDLVQLSPNGKGAPNNDDDDEEDDLDTKRPEKKRDPDDDEDDDDDDDDDDALEIKSPA